MTAVFFHEIRLLFSGLTAYVYGAFSLFFVAVYMMYYNLSAAYANFEYALAGASFAFVLMIPIITMRIIAEEKKQKTDQLLYALPITTTQIVVGKFLAVFLTSVIPMCIVIAYPLILQNYGNLYLPTAYGSLVAILILELIIALLIKNMAGNPLLSKIFGGLSMAAAVALYVYKSEWFEGLFPKILENISVYERFYEFVDGIFDYTHVVYFISVIVFFLFLTVQSLEKRRYN